MSLEEQYQLISKMSKNVKLTNTSLGGVLASLEQKALQGKNQDKGNEQELNVDPRILLNKTNLSIKNLNHSLMKLVAV